LSKAAEILDRLGLMANWLAHVGRNAGGFEIQPTYNMLPRTVRIDWDGTSPASGVKKWKQQTAACGPQRVAS
jgi:hypothetical protein